MSAPAIHPDPYRWKALIFIALAQLMVALDSTIVNIALPTAQADLNISDGNRQWAITAYALAFGSLLLLGGRICDLWGRKPTFILGLTGFAAASVLGGAATNETMLLISRALQGAFGALLAPAALSLLAVMFTDTVERAKAFGIFSAIAGGGSALGLILGGLLTEYLNWRWTFYINIPFAVAAVIGALTVIREPAHSRNTARLDIPGVVLATLGLIALVYGFTRAETDGWAAASTLILLTAAVILLGSFALVESRVKDPLLPLRVVTERTRAGAFLGMALAVIGMFGLFLFLTYYLQVVRGYSPVTTGLAFLPLVVGTIAGSTQIGPRLTTRIGPRLLMASGLLTAVLGMLLLTRIDVDTSYPALILPSFFILGLGLGIAFLVGMTLATHGIRPQDAGIASAMANASQQIGGALGTALLNTIAASATTAYLTTRTTETPVPQAVQQQAMVHGYTTAIWWAVAILTLSALIALILIRTRHRPGTHPTPNPDTTADTPHTAAPTH
ncbi:MFS transporter [Streptomyces sp. NPDC052042]|uniref:MFS transporter n=1 Tax=Streptomyces sp. NPDC052042 TaxID=3365683 RepID=UPI0037CFDDF4